MQPKSSSPKTKIVKSLKTFTEIFSFLPICHKAWQQMQIISPQHSSICNFQKQLNPQNIEDKKLHLKTPSIRKFICKETCKVLQHKPDKKRKEKKTTIPRPLMLTIITQKTRNRTKEKKQMVSCPLIEKLINGKKS